MLIEKNSTVQNLLALKCYLPMFELLRKNANRCLSLVVLEIVVIGLFHYVEWSYFLRSEIIALSLHLILSLFWLCFYVIMRSKYLIGTTKRSHRKRLLGDPVLYIVSDYVLIHVILWLVFGEFTFHPDELLLIIVGVYCVNLYFDTHKHHCCHDHCK